MNNTHASPSTNSAGAVTLTDQARLREHLRFLTTTPKPRNYLNVEVLDSVAAYIGRHLKEAGARVEEQPYKADGRAYRNVIGSFGPVEGPRIIVGAHYDVCGEQPGADDNGSGVAALLELARLLGQKKQLPGRIDLVAYSLEEPPYFMSEQMGSYVHARSLRDQKVEVRGMLALDMLGYYNDEEGGQEYPIAQMRQQYGSRGNFIAVVQKTGGGQFAEEFARRFEEVAKLPVKQYVGPPEVPGVSFSDHVNFWKHGYSALMLTNTAFYRNPNYHQATDTMDTLNYERIAQITDAMAETLWSMRY